MSFKGLTVNNTNPITGFVSILSNRSDQVTTSDGVYSSFLILSAALSGNNNYTDVAATLSANSGNWDSTYSTVLNNSSNWDESVDVSYISGVVTSLYNTLSANSGNWDSTYSTVLSSSGGWNTLGNINIDGGQANSIYGGILPIDGGNA